MGHVWHPLTIDDIVERFTAVDVDWWIAGGVAIDLFLGWVSRPHDDIDIEMFRDDRDALFEAFAGWDLHSVSQGTLRPWGRGDRLEPEVFGIWGRPSPGEPWAIEVILADGDARTWRFRRDPSITLPRSELTRRSSDGVSYCTPEVQLLYKAKRARPKDDVDFVRCLHLLEADQKRWLRAGIERLDAGHPWVAALDRSLRLPSESG